MALTPDFKASLQSNPGPATSNGVPHGTPMDDNSFKQWLGGSESATPTTPTTPTAPATPTVTSQFQDIGNQESQTLQSAGADVTKNAKTALGSGPAAKEDFGSFGANFGADLATRLASLGHIVGDVANTAFAPILHTVAALVPPELKNDYKGAVNWAADKITNNPTILAALNKANNALDQNPDLKQALTSDLPGALSLIGGSKASGGNPELNLSDAKGVVSDVTDTAKGAVDKVKQTVAESKATKVNAAEDAAKANQTKTLQNVAKDWEKPATVNKPTYNKTRAVLEKDPSTPQFLAENGLNPGAHVEDGKFNTSDSADALRQTAGQMSKDTLRPSLEAADHYTPKTDVEAIQQDAIKALNEEKGVTAGDRERGITNIKKETAALQRKYPDGMSLTEMHDAKIDYAKNGGYNPIKSAADNVKATANRAYASALQKTVEATAPSDIPVGAFNKYLSKFYRGADYLDTLHGKVAPASPAQLVARGVAKFGGAALGGHFGGGVVSEFAGYQIGKALEAAVENMTNPMRATFLKNLEVTNPEAFTKVQAFLKNASEGNTGIPRLPEGKTMITPAPSQEAQMESRANTILGPKK